MYSARSLYAALLLFPVICAALQSYPRVETRDVATGLDDPIGLAAGPDGNLWLLERSGRVYRIDPTTGLKRQVLRIPEVVQSRGAYGMTIDRDFTDSAWIYFYYPILNVKGWTEGRVSRFRYDPAQDSLVAREDIMTGLYTVEWTPGGGMAMLPDRTVLFGTGDGIDYYRDVQKHESMAGKVFRIGADGSIPQDNPWASATFPTNMLWESGFSNLSDITLGRHDVVYAIDRGNGGLSDEVNVLMKGKNYGWWPVRGFCDLGSEEERCNDSNAVDPLYEWYRGREGGVIPTGIVWFEEGSIDEWEGSLLITTAKDGLWQLVLRDDGRGTQGVYHYLYSTDDLDRYGDLRDITVTPDGRIWVAVRNRAGTPGEDRIVELLAVDFQPHSDGVADILTEEVVSGLATPQQLAWDHEDMLWIAERDGRITRANAVTGQLTTVADLSDRIVNAESAGVRGFALHPRYPDSAWAFVSYVSGSAGEPEHLRLVRYHVDIAGLRFDGEETLLIGDIPAGSSRNGGRLAFDREGMLMLVTGDAGLPERAADTSSLSGKILRLTTDGEVPTDNPRADRGAPEGFIWSRGLRDPEGIVRSEAGLLYAVTRGGTVDELELLRSGRNFGWPGIDGYCDNLPSAGEEDVCRGLDVEEPMREWRESVGVSGAAWYGASAIPLWNNSLLITGDESGDLLQVRLEAKGGLIETENRYLDGEFGRLGSVTVSRDGAAFVTTSNALPGGERVDRLIRILAVPDVTLGDESTLEVRTVAEHLDTPWEVVWGPDEWLWITERAGRISRIDPTTGEKRLLLDLGNDVFEFAGSGMLSMALHPDFGVTPWVYVVYTYRVNPDSSNLTMFERLERYEYDALQGKLINPVVLIDSIEATIYHDGSRLLVLPDNTLMMTTGDAANRALPQDHMKLNGKVLRIGLDGSIPEDNPWAGAPWPANLVWSTGHRNAQGLARSPDGTIYSSEHGDDTDDEMNIILKGRNYGYPEVHGYCDDTVFFRYRPEESRFCVDSNVVEPIRSWTPTLGLCGLAYYAHDTIAAWKNSLLMVTLGIKKPVLPLYANSLIQMQLSPDGRRIVDEKHYFLQRFGRLRAICVAPDGRVFIASSNEDTRGEPRPGGDRIVEIRPKISDSFIPYEPKTFDRSIVPQPILEEGVVHFGEVVGEGSLLLVDATGRVVRREAFDGGDRWLFRRDGLSSGVYYLRFVGSGGPGEFILPIVLE